MPQERVTVNFVNAEIEAVSRAVSAIVKRPIVVDPRVKGTLTLYSEEPLTPRETLMTFLSTLRGLGFSMVEVSGLLKIVPEAEAKLQTDTVAVGATTKRRGDQIVTQVFQLKHENPNNLVAVLRPLISPNNTINANPGNNTLVITDYADNLQRLGRIIAALDSPNSTDVEVVPIRHAVASDLAQMVQRFADGGSAGGAAPGTAVAGSSTSVIADPRTNSLLIRAASPAKLAQIRATIDKLDRPQNTASPSGNIYVVYLKNADATRMATVLRAAYAANNSGGAGGSTLTGTTGSTGAAPAATPSANTGLSALGSNSNTASTQSTAPVTASAGPSTGGFVQADPATNSLIITAPEPVYRQLRAVIDQLDSRRAQVYVESMIVKMDATKASQFGFQWQGLLSNNGNSAGVYAGTNYSTGTSANLISLTAAAATGTTSSSSALSLGSGLNIGLVNKIAGAYTIGALANFLASETGANILSTPNLVTLDNEEAKIVIGQNVPFVTGTYATTGTTSSTINPFQTVERKDVGLTLRVRPQIGENGTVRMTIYQENSSVASTGTNGPTTDKSAIETTVVVNDGQMLVLGGLLKDEYADGEDRVPGLSSVPILGHLFKAQKRERVKRNLMVFLRPVVMRGPNDTNSLTLDRYDAIRASQQASQPKESAVLGINDAPVLPERPSSPQGAMPPLMAPRPATPAEPASGASDTPQPASQAPASRPGGFDPNN